MSNSSSAGPVRFTPAAVRDFIRAQGLDPKKSLGQNFLLDEAALRAVVDAAELTADDTVLEIGPGLGMLTQGLAARVARVVAVELDDRLISVLRAAFVTREHVTIIHGDILTLDPALLVGPTAGSSAADLADSADGASSSHLSAQAVDSDRVDNDRVDTGRVGDYKVVANLPYYITSPVLRHLLEASTPPKTIVVMVQKEVAERICAAPGALSILAVSVQFYAQPEIIRTVPAAAFYPQPKVDSAVLRLALRPQPAVTDIAPARFFGVVRAGFSQKRKQLLNSLSGGLGLAKPDVEAALVAAAVDPTRRAQTVTLDEWGRICRALA